MSALQLQALLEHICNKSIHDVHFCFTGGRLFINYYDEGGNIFHRSFGTDGTFVEHDWSQFEIKNSAGKTQ